MEGRVKPAGDDRHPRGGSELEITDLLDVVARSHDPAHHRISSHALLPFLIPGVES